MRRVGNDALGSRVGKGITGWGAVGARLSLNGCPGRAGDVGEIGEEQVYDCAGDRGCLVLRPREEEFHSRAPTSSRAGSKDIINYRYSDTRIRLAGRPQAVCNLRYSLRLALAERHCSVFPSPILSPCHRAQEAVDYGFKKGSWTQSLIVSSVAVPSMTEHNSLICVSESAVHGACVSAGVKDPGASPKSSALSLAAGGQDVGDMRVEGRTLAASDLASHPAGKPWNFGGQGSRADGGQPREAWEEG